MHKKNLLVCLQSYFRKALAFKQPQYFEGFKLLCNWLSVNFQIQNRRRRQKSQTQHQCCIVTVNFALLLYVVFKTFVAAVFSKLGLSLLLLFAEVLSLLLLSQYYIGFLFWLYFQAKIERKKRRVRSVQKHYSKQWCGVTQQTHEKEQGIKMHPHYFYTCTQKENLQRFFF